jgi:hypothetical protein
VVRRLAGQGRSGEEVRMGRAEGEEPRLVGGFGEQRLVGLWAERGWCRGWGGRV